LLSLLLSLLYGVAGYNHSMAETSSNEMLDVVDLNDVVVGSKTRGEVHRLQLPHRSVHVLVFNPDKDLLLQKRSMLKDECAGMWDSSCAGHVEAGQSYAETVAREFEEELGVALTADPDYLFKMQPTPGNGMEFAAVYRVCHDGPFTYAEDEIDELQWFSTAQLDAWVVGRSAVAGAVLTTGFCEIWQRYRAPALPGDSNRADSA
jgi:isopentenyldiphosphate isomerase